MRLIKVHIRRVLSWPPVGRAARFTADLYNRLGMPKIVPALSAWRPSAPVAMGLLSALLTLQTLRFSSVEANWQTATGFLAKPLLFLLNWAPIAGLLLFLYFLAGRTYLAFLLACLPVLGLALVNYYKLLLRGDPLLFADLQLIGEASAMRERYAITPTLAVVLTVLLDVGLVAALLRQTRGLRPPRAFARVAGCAACAALAFGYAHGVLPDDALYARTAISYPWLPMQSYVAHGVVYPFLRSSAAMGDKPPEGYDPAAAAAALAAYAPGDIPQGQKVNIIAVMLEAYGDFSAFGELTFAADPYADWHALAAEGYSGQLVVNIFAGETVNTERAFLTGYLDPSENYRAPLNSFVWYLRGQGYRTQGSHPGNNWFYNRLNVNRYLGFERYDFYEDRFCRWVKNGAIMPDRQFVPTILTDFRQNKASGSPLFSFHVTYQNHGPYPETPAYDQVYLPWKPGYDEANYNIANNYLAGVADTGRQLRALAEALRQEAEPVVLMLFGDHNPWWGDGNATYEMFGVNIDRSTEAGFFHYYATPYLFWANDAAKAALGQSLTGEGGRLSPAFLLPRFFQLAGWKGSAYLQAVQALMAHTPFVNRQCFWQEGELTGADGDEGEAPSWLLDFRRLEYYEKHSLSAPGKAGAQRSAAVCEMQQSIPGA